MATHEQAPAGPDSGVATANETLTVTDNRTGKTYEVPIEDGTVRAMDFRQIKIVRRRLRADDLRPGVHEHGVVQAAPSPTSTATRASCEYRGYPIEQLAERARYLEIGLPAHLRRAAHQRAARRLGPRDHVPHDHPRERQEVHGGLPLRRAPDGHARRHGRRALDVLPRRRRRRRPGVARVADDRGSSRKMPTLAAFATGTASGLPYVYPDNDLSLHGQLPAACSSR